MHRQRVSYVRLHIAVDRRRSGAVIILYPNRKAQLMGTVTVGHQVNFTITYLDQNGNPMLTPVTPDAAPSWSDVGANAAGFTQAADGSSAQLVASVAGQDTVSVSVTVGGKKFSASDLITDQPAPQVLTSVAINEVVN